MMRVKIGDAVLYHGDAKNILPHLDPVGCLVTDPPYMLMSGGKTGYMANSFDGYQNTGELVPCAITWPEIMQLVRGALKNQAHAYVMSDDRNLEFAIPAAAAVGLKRHRVLVWKKNNGTPSRWYHKNCEFTLFLRSGPAFTINTPGTMQGQDYPRGSETEHPTEKPVGLMRSYIENSSKEGDVVLDPFMGSGTTAIAALRSGRRFVGCEISEKFFDLACRRVSAFYTSGRVDGAQDLFSQEA